MIDIFDRIELDLNNIICHSGGAQGADTYWADIGKEYGVKTRAYSYKTKYHDSPDKVEISDEDYNEGISQVNKANKILGRFGIHKYMNLLARNWAQIKYSDEVFAIGTIVEPGKRGSRGYYNKSKYQVVDGGTGYAVQMGINTSRKVFVFDQDKDKWFRWSYSSLSFIELSDVPDIKTQNFAGIGTREIKQNGIKAISEVYNLTFNKI
jgi:hypothetical protein